MPTRPTVLNLTIEIILTAIATVVVPLIVTIVGHARYRRLDRLQDAKELRERKNDERERRLEDRSEFQQAIMAQLQASNDKIQRLEERYLQLDERYTELLHEHARLLGEQGRIEAEFQHKLVLLESASAQLPLAMWVKDGAGRMLWVNDVYEAQFLKPRGYTRVDYINNFDDSVWPNEIAVIFGSHDAEVWESEETKVYDEPVEVIAGQRQMMRFMKYLYRIGDIKVGTAGVAFPVLPAISNKPGPVD